MLRPLASSSARTLHRQILIGRISRRFTTASRAQNSHFTGTSHPEEGAKVNINGWIRSIRKQKRVAFAHISDGRQLDASQAVLEPAQAEGLSNGAAVSLTGTWQASPGGKQSHELKVETARLLGENDATTFPIQKKFQTQEFLRTLPHLRGRLPANSLLLRLRSEVIGCCTRYFDSQGYIQTHPPILTSSDCEGAGEVFSVATLQGADAQSNGPIVPPKADVTAFFRSPKYLTVSSQLHLEALAQSVGNVWTLSPTFRAEKSDTPRHLSEFYMLEAEACFVDNMSQIMDVVEGLIKSIARHVSDTKTGQELLASRRKAGEEELHDQSPHVSENELRLRFTNLLREWPRITYHDAIRALQHAVDEGTTFEFSPTMGGSLQAEHERWLAEVIGDHGPVFVTDYPRAQKAFYMSPSKSEVTNNDMETVACFDLLVPDLCELVGGSMREHRFKELLENMRRQGMLKTTNKSNSLGTGELSTEGQSTLEDVPHNLRWYTDLRRYGSVPHGGFGIGFDRLLCYLSGVPNVRDVVAFPRWHGRCDC